MDQTVQAVIASIVSVVIGTLVGWAMKSISGTKCREHLKNEAIANGILSLLRDELVHAHNRYVSQSEPIDVRTLECLNRTYQSYHQLGGNDVGTKLYEEISSLDVSP